MKRADGVLVSITFFLAFQIIWVAMSEVGNGESVSREDLYIERKATGVKDFDVLYICHKKDLIQDPVPMTTYVEMENGQLEAFSDKAIELKLTELNIIPRSKEEALEIAKIYLLESRYSSGEIDMDTTPVITEIGQNTFKVELSATYEGGGFIFYKAGVTYDYVFIIGPNTFTKEQNNEGW